MNFIPLASLIELVVFVAVLVNIANGHDLGCPNAMFGSDCSCTSHLSQATCTNGTWTVNGNLQITQDVWFNSDTIHVLGDFSSGITANIYWMIDATNASKSGRLKVDGDCVMKGTAHFLIKADSVGQFDISVVEFGGPTSTFSQLSAVTTWTGDDPDTGTEAAEELPCVTLTPFNISLQIRNNVLLLNFFTVLNIKHQCRALWSLDVLWIVLFVAGSLILVSVTLTGAWCWKNRHKKWWESKVLRDYIEEGYDESTQHEELETFL